LEVCAARRRAPARRETPQSDMLRLARAAAAREPRRLLAARSRGLAAAARGTAGAAAPPRPVAGAAPAAPAAAGEADPHRQVSLGDYGAQCDRLFQRLEEAFERSAVEDALDGGEFDVVSSMGVLSIKLGRHGTWVLNRQAPNLQIWWSSPLSGPKRFYYNMRRAAWLNTRDDGELLDLLSREVSKVTGRRFTA
jgi:frataxin